MSQVNVIYCASGRNFCWEACLSAKSLKQHMPNSKISLYSDMKVSCSHIDVCSRIYDDYSFGSEIRRTKVKKIDGILAAAHNLVGAIVFLDTDTFVTCSLEAMFEVMAGYDIAVAHDTWRNFAPYEWSTPFNSGVIFFQKNQRVVDFLVNWRNEYARTEDVPDQVSFHKVLTQSGLRVYIMPPEMNARCGEPIQLSGHVKIVHKHYSQIVLENPAVIAALVNARTENRVLILDKRKMIATLPNFELETIVLEETDELRNLARQFTSVDWETEDWL